MELMQWKLDNRKIAALKPLKKNPRQLDKHNEEHLTKSLEKFGICDFPVINTDNTIIGGHQRIKTLKKLGYKEIPVLVADRDMSSEEVEELNIRLNKNTGDWDWDKLANEWDIADLVSWGFSLDELDIDMQEDDELSCEEETKKPEKSITNRGDIYKLGSHTLMCGDSTNVSEVEKLTQNDHIDILFTDPMYDEKINKFIDVIQTIKVYNILLMTTFKQAIDIINYSRWNFKFDSILYFKTPSSMMNKKVPYYLHKNIFYMTKDDKTESIFSCDNAKGHFSENSYYPSVIESKKNTQEGHSLSKPIESIILILSGYKCKNVIDMFGGSGSTLLACEKTKRDCYMMEIEPLYCDLCVQRWVNYRKRNGKDATVLKNGEIIEWEAND